MLLRATLVALSLWLSFAPSNPLSEDVAHTIIHSSPHGHGAVWNYEEGTVLVGMDTLWRTTQDPAILAYIQTCVDRFVGDDGSIRTYKRDQFTLDNVLMGRQLLVLYDATRQQKYKLAADMLYAQLKAQPHTPSGGFWHKKRYPNQMWLDGLYMAEPFYAEYAVRFHHPQDFRDIALQFRLIEDHTRDRRNGLLYHAWDESHTERWANPATGDSPTFWSRGMGWFGMALVDTLDVLPVDTPAHAELLAMLKRFAHAIAAQQDSHGVWQQVTDKAGQPGNYEESSASAMFVYTLAKGIRKGWLPASYLAVAQSGYAALQHQFLEDHNGTVQFTSTAGAVGLGGSPTYRDGNYAYYTGVQSLTNDDRGMGALLLASVEMERLTKVDSSTVGVH